MQSDSYRDRPKIIEELFRRHAESIYETMLEQTRNSMNLAPDRRGSGRRLKYDRRQRVESHDGLERRNGLERRSGLERRREEQGGGTNYGTL